MLSFVRAPMTTMVCLEIVQARYQALHRMPSGEEPYIAAIVAPYMKPEAVSHIAWFYVSYGGSSWPEYGKQPLAQYVLSLWALTTVHNF